MFVAMNQFSINEGRGAEFEEQWRTRESYLQGFDGFIHFALLKGDEPGDYVSHTIWRSREDFLKWTQSDAFKKTHSARSAEGVARAVIESALPVSDADLKGLVTALERRFGRKVEAIVRVNPDLIGGARITVGDTVIDDSVQGKLTAMATQLTA